MRADGLGAAMTFLYFGYGSNMLTERLRARCPGAKCVGTAEVIDYALEFSKLSVDGSGKATLGHLEGRNQTSFGVVFEIPLAEREKLDKAEGVGNGGYERNDNFPVCLVDGDELTTSCYLATETDHCLKPYDWYLALTIAGAEEHGLDAEYIIELRRTAYTVDQKHKRCSREKAVDALGKAGVDDYRHLLAPQSAVRLHGESRP